MISQKSFPIIVILLVALALRLHGLTVPGFWVDEASSALSAQQPSIWIDDSHPPLYYALLYLWTTFSFSDYWIRLLSVIFGVATVVCVYFAGKEMFTRKGGIWAAAFLSVLSFHIAHSQEARMYALVVLLFAAGIWSVYRIVERGDKGAWIAFGVLSTLIAYSQAMAVLYSLTLGLVLFLHLITSGKLTRRTFITFVVCNAIVLLIYLPWAYSLLFLPSGIKHSGVEWIREPSLWAPLEIPFYKFSFSSIPDINDILSGLGLALPFNVPNAVFSLPLVLLLALLFLKKKDAAQSSLPISICVASFVIPYVLTFVLSYLYQPMLLPRSLLPTAVPLVLLLGASCALVVPYRAVKAALLTATLAAFCLGSFYYHRYLPLAKSEWREVSLYLQEAMSETDCVVHFGWLSDFLLRRYDRSGTFDRECMLSGEIFIGSGGTMTPQSLQAVMSRVPLSPGQTVWVVDRQWSLKEHPVRESVRSWSQTIFAKDFRSIEVTRFTVPNLPLAP